MKLKCCMKVGLMCVWVFVVISIRLVWFFSCCSRKLVLRLV